MLVLALGLSAAGCGGPRRTTDGNVAAGDRKPIAEVGGKPVYDHDITSRVQGRLSRLEHEEYEVKKQALNAYINGILLARQGKAEGLSSQALLQRHADAKVAQPTDAEVRAYYDAHRGLRNHPFDKIKEQLRQSLLRQRIQQARARYLSSLRGIQKVKIFLAPPPVQVSYDPQRLLGNPHAPVTIVEFSDFQCPYCRATEPTLRAVVNKYRGKVNLAYRDLPIRQLHPQAEEAAEAARCAEEQGNFWKYHDLLMSNPPRLDHASLLADARSLGLNQKQFSSCLSSKKYTGAVGTDLEAARNLGITGTPAFFINGVLLSGEQPAAAFDRAIRKALAESRSAASFSSRP